MLASTHDFWLLFRQILSMSSLLYLAIYLRDHLLPVKVEYLNNLKKLNRILLYEHNDLFYFSTDGYLDYFQFLKIKNATKNSLYVHNCIVCE